MMRRGSSAASEVACRLVRKDVQRVDLLRLLAQSRILKEAVGGLEDSEKTGARNEVRTGTQTSNERSFLRLCRKTPSRLVEPNR